MGGVEDGEDGGLRPSSDPGYWAESSLTHAHQRARAAGKTGEPGGCGGDIFGDQRGPPVERKKTD